MNKKILSLLTFVFIFFIPLIAVLHAQSPEMMRPMPASQVLPAQPFGQTHSYSVTLRGNAEAVVSMKAVFTNYEEATMSALTLQVPKGEIKNISAYQVIIEPQCAQYVSEPITQGIEKGTRTNSAYQEKCISYNDPDYYNGYYYGNMKYIKALVNTDADSIVVTLAQGVGPQKSGSIVLYYRATGLVKKDTFGAFNYSFETLKSDTTIRSLSVGVNTDSDLFLEGTDQSVNYDTSISSAPLMARDAGMKQGSFMSPEFDSYYMGIGYGRITKSTSDLQPFDSFTVEGRYAKSRSQLYGKRFVIGGLIVVGLLILVGVLLYKLVKSLKKNYTTSSQKSSSSSSHPILMMVGLGLLSSLGAAIYTVFLYIFMTMMERVYYSDVNTLIMLFIVLISGAIYIVLIFGPALFVGWKKGVWWGVGTLFITIILLTLYLMLFFLYMFLKQQTMYSPGYPTFSPAMDSTILR